MKTHAKVTRRDSMNEHVHALDGGGETLGQLVKPSQSTQFPQHTHLYQHEGKTHETGPASNEPGHTHEVIPDAGGKTGPSKAPPAQTSFGPRNDSADHVPSLKRIGGHWHLRNENGVTIGKGKTPAEACARFDSADYDEAIAKRAAGIQGDDPYWAKAVDHSKQIFGEAKWPFVIYTHKILSGVSV